MWRCDQILEPKDWMIMVGRLRLEYVERGSPQLSAIEELVQDIKALDQPATGKINQKSSRFHESESFAVDHPAGIRSQRRMQGNKVRCLKKMVEARELHSTRALRGNQRVVGQHPGVESPEQICQCGADVSKTH